MTWHFVGSAAEAVKLVLWELGSKVDKVRLLILEDVRMYGPIRLV